MKKLPLGISDFKTLIEEDRYFVDKSLFIKEIIDADDKISLIPRPRRFGKTLNLSMLRYFYEAPLPNSSQSDSPHLFKKLKIWQAGDEYINKYRKYPVIFLTFKDVKNTNWEKCYLGIKNVIIKEFKRHSYLLNADLDNFDKIYINKIISEAGTEIDYQNSLKYLSEILFNHYGANPVILIDEYDMPIQAGFNNGYYSEVIEFIRNLLSGAFKDNQFLERGVLTGILRIAKESIFSGLNNIEVCSIVSKKYSDKFGFLENEVFELFEYKQIDYNKNEITEWYNGYKFGKYEIYNPWSILKFASNDGEFGLYWINTSSNDLVKELMADADKETKNELEDLLNGKEIEKVIDDNIVYAEVKNNAETVWNFLFFSGYLKIISSRYKNRRKYYKLVIPNNEILYFFENTVQDWLIRSEANLNLKLLKSSLLSGKIDIFESIFTKFALNSLSYFDVKGKEPEKFYHAFVLGSMFHLNDVYEIKSNRESGYGRYDVMMIPKNKNNYGIIFEFKSVDKILNETLESAVSDALKQIKEKKYRAELESMGIKNIKEIAIAFSGKDILMKY